MIQERNLPTSPSPSLYSPHSKSSFNKSGIGQPNSKKQLLIGQTGSDSSRTTLQLIQSISLVGVSIDHTLRLILQSDIPSSGKLVAAHYHSMVHLTALVELFSGKFQTDTANVSI